MTPEPSFDCSEPVHPSAEAPLTGSGPEQPVERREQEAEDTEDEEYGAEPVQVGIRGVSKYPESRDGADATLRDYLDATFRGYPDRTGSGQKLYPRRAGRGGHPDDRRARDRSVNCEGCTNQ